MQIFLSRGDIADHLGLSVETVKGYDRKGLLPPPDAKTGRVYGWTQQTIDTWNETRPGMGARTDLTDRTRKRSSDY